MNIPKWLLPVLAGVAALAVGVAGVLIGQRFAPAETVATPSGTAVVPVLAPIPDLPVEPGTGPDGETGADPGTDAGMDAGAGGRGIQVSPAVAEREVTLPGSDPRSIDPSLLDLIGTLAEAADPVFTIMEYDADDAGPGTPDDPCAPRNGEPGDECPDGLRTTVFGLTGIYDFRAGGQAYPPTFEEFREHGNPYGTLYCDGLDPADDEVPFGIAGTAPATYTVRYWPTARPGDVQVIDGIASSPEDIAAFEQALADGEDPMTVVGMPMSCLNLTAVEPNTVYTAVVTGVDVLGRESDPHTLQFNSAGEPVRPGAQITTIGENLVFVAAPHRHDQLAEARVALVEGEATPTCDIPADGSQRVPALTDAEAEISTEQLVELGFLAQYTRKRVQTFVIPEGSTALVCVRWYPEPTGSMPSWERTAPIYESSAVLQSPDRVLPTLRVDTIEGYDPDLAAIDIAVSTAEGTRCGLTFAWEPGRPADLPVDICGAAALRAAGVNEEDGRLWTVGFSGDLVVTIRARLDNGLEARTRALLPGPDGGCRGRCEPPDPERYVIALDSITEPTGQLCGSNFSPDCIIATRQVAAGTIAFTVTWDQGASNGNSTWNVTPTRDEAVDHEKPEMPQIDLDERWTVHGAGVSLAKSASYLLHADRPVDYTLRLTTPEHAGVAAPSCGRDGGVLEISGRAERPTPVSLSGLCAGEMYLAELELTDADGNSAVWGLRSVHTWWGEGARVQVPGVEVTIRYQVQAQGYTRSYISMAGISVGSAGTDLLADRSSCDEDGVLAMTGSFDGSLAAQNTVIFRLRMQSSGGWHPDDCARSLDGEPAKHVTTVIDFADLTAVDGVTIEAPEAFGATVRLWAVPVRD